jgi:Lecithin retinol acyltransferase
MHDSAIDQRKTATRGQAQGVAGLPLGAHLITRRRGYDHHGVYAGEGKVVHYAGWSAMFKGGPVEETSLDRFGGGNGYRVQFHGETPFSAREIVARARSRIGESKYRLLTNNCEHFCHWCLYGESRSQQVERLRALPAAVARKFLAGFLRVRARISPPCSGGGILLT